MGEVSEMFDVNPSLIRFWEKRFDILRPKKNAKGNRLFTPEDVENLKIIYHLVKERGMTLAGAEKYMKDSRQQLKRDVGVVEILQRIRSMLVDIREELDSEAKQAENEIIIRSEQVVHEEPEVQSDVISIEEPYDNNIDGGDLRKERPQVTEILSDKSQPEEIENIQIEDILQGREEKQVPLPEPELEPEPEPERPRYIELSLFD